MAEQKGWGLMHEALDARLWKVGLLQAQGQPPQSLKEVNDVAQKKDTRIHDT